MKTKRDWSVASALPPDELARALNEDCDAIDDNPVSTEAELAAMRLVSRGASLHRHAGKVVMTIPTDPETLAAFESTGEGWQARVDALLHAAALNIPKPRL